MKRILVMLLSLILLTNTASAVFASQIEDYYNPKAEFLKEIGVMTALPSNYDAYVSRAEFAMYAARLINISEYGQADKRLFIDLPMEHWATYAINGLVERGLIASAPDGKFRPDDIITTPEAVKILVCALGYQPYAEGNGGYPGGYLKTARQTGIIKDVTNGNSLTYADVVEMLFDALNTEVMQGIRYSGDNVQYGHYEDETLLSVYRNIYCIEGKVTAADGVAINKDYYADFGEIAIENELFDYKGDPFSYLGKDVILYYLKNERGQSSTVYIFPKGNKNAVVQFDSKDFATYEATTNKIAYYDGERLKSLNVSAGISVVKNGDIVSSDVENTIKNVKKGTYTLIDSGNDGTYETLVISEYKNVVVSYVDKNANLIYDKDNKGIPVDATDDETRKVIIYKDSQQIALSDISVNDVLTVYESNTYTKIYVNTQYIAGRISSITKNSNSTEICIDDKKYEIDSDVAEKQGISVRVGMEGTFVIDMFGKVAYIKLEKSGDNARLGYIVAYGSEGIIDKKVKIRLFVPSVGLKEYELSDKVRIDGETAKTEEEVEELLGKYNANIVGQVIFFKDEGGIIKNIDTPHFNNGKELENTIKPNVSATDVRYRQGKFGKTIITNSSTVIIGVPDDAKLVDSEEYDFSVLAANGISISADFNVESYKFDEKSGFDDVVVIKNYASGNPSTELVLVDEITKVLNGDDVVECLSYYKDGNQSEIFVDYGKSLLQTGIKQGDILRIGTDAKGDVVNWKIIFSYKADAVASDVNEVNYSSPFNTTDRVIFGYVKSVNDGVLKLYRDESNPDIIDEVFNLNDITLTIYDSGAAKEEYVIRSGKYNEITTRDAVGTPAMAIVRTNLAQIKDVIIYK